MRFLVILLVLGAVIVLCLTPHKAAHVAAAPAAVIPVLPLATVVALPSPSPHLPPSPAVQHQREARIKLLQGNISCNQREIQGVKDLAPHPSAKGDNYTIQQNNQRITDLQAEIDKWHAELHTLQAQN